MLLSIALLISWRKSLVTKTELNELVLLLFIRRIWRQLWGSQVSHTRCHVMLFTVDFQLWRDKPDLALEDLCAKHVICLVRHWVIWARVCVRGMSVYCMYERYVAGPHNL